MIMALKGVCNVIEPVRVDATKVPDAAAEAGLPDAARRALQEAQSRRIARKGTSETRPREVNGRQGPEPVRYGDWENKGIASDF